MQLPAKLPKLRFIGLGVTEDSRRVLMVYLNPYNHYDQPTGVYEQEVRATSGQRSTLYALEGPGGLLVDWAAPHASKFALLQRLPSTNILGLLRRTAHMQQSTQHPAPRIVALV